MVFLKQSAAVDLVVGPFVDDTDGKTVETGLTVTQADCQLSKNGGAVAQKNSATAATHLGGGHYKVPLNATDTGTLGVLRLYINEGGALPVWMDCMVMPANVWDSLFGAARLGVDVVQVSGDAAAADSLEAVLDGTRAKLYLSQLNIVAGGNDSAITATASGSGDGMRVYGGTSGSGLTAMRGGSGAADLYFPNGGVPADVTRISGSTVAADNLELYTTGTAMPVNAAQIGGSGAAATGAGKGFQGLVTGKFVTGSLSSTGGTTNLSGFGDDTFNGRTLTIIGGNRGGEQRTILDYIEAGGVLTFAALTGAPANNDEFYIA